MRLWKLGPVLVCLLFLQTEATENEEESNPCPDDSLPCNSGQCVKREEWCDKTKNCRDESDEAYCATTWWRGDLNNCKETHFLCKNKQCVPRVAKCDGHRDCEDGSDEFDCGPGEHDDYDDYHNTETTSDVPTKPTTTEIYSKSDGLEDSDLSITTTQVPKVAVTQNAQLSSSVVNFYANRMEQERGQVDLQSPASVLTRSTTASGSALAPERHQNTTRPITTTSRPLLSTTGPTRAYEQRRYHDPSPTPIPVSPRQSVLKKLPDTSLNPTAYPPRSGHYNGQTSTPSYQSTRSYINGQYHTQRSTPYDSRVDRNQYLTQTSRQYENRRTSPYQYPTHPTRRYVTRRDPYQYHNQPTRSYESRIDPNQYQTQPPRQNVFRPIVPTVQPQYSYRTTATPNSRNHYGAVTQRVYVDRENYYDGYYDQSGQFVVIRRSQRQQAYRNPPPVDERRHRQQRQDSEIPATEPAIFERHLKAPSRFYFAKNYTRIYGDENFSYLRRGREWILSVQNSTGGWGKDTPRALIALSLINNSFANGTYENDVMQKYFQVYLGTRLLRGEAAATTLNRLAMSVNALLATCQNPKNFHGTDLTDLIQKRLNSRNRDSRTRVNPAVYLSLCLADTDLTHAQEHDLMTRLTDHVTPDEYARDMLSLSISAFSCHLRRQNSRDSEYRRSVDSMLSNATTKLLERMQDDGSFGSVYGTALAAQALLSLNDTKHWDPESTFAFLREQQKRDGSFGDFLATYLAMPVLSGRSLLHLRNTQCTPPHTDRDLTPSEIAAFRGPKHYVRYSLLVGHPRVSGSLSVRLLVPRDIGFFDVMRVAQQENDAFRFSYEERNGKMFVYSISNIPNDAEQGLEWNLYAKESSDLEINKLNPQERVLGDIREFFPRSDQHVIFWYHPSVFRN